MIQQRSNWAGNYTFTAPEFHYPQTVQQIQEVVKRAGKLRVLGSSHSFNDLADSPEEIISLEHLDKGLVIDHGRHRATVGGGVKYGQICRELDREGYALPNLASLPHISVAGACATASHGSGVTNGNLATAVSELEIVGADGELIILSRDQNGEQFQGAVASLGGLGVVTKLTLDLIPAFKMSQVVYLNLSFEELEGHFDEIVSKAYSVSLFTGWQQEKFNQVWLKRRVAEDVPFEWEPELFGARLAANQLHPLETMSGEACTPQLGVPGPWYARLPHFRMEFTPSSGEELQSEYFVPHQHALKALRAINRLGDRLAPLLQISEVRTIAADNLWMSPCYQQARISIHFTWKKNWEGVRPLLGLIENELAPFDAIPHWGKLFTVPPKRIQSLYPRLKDFQQLLSSFDPGGKFRNPFLDRYIFASK